MSTNGITFILAAWGGGREVYSFYIEVEKFCEGGGMVLIPSIVLSCMVNMRSSVQV